MDENKECPKEPPEQTTFDEETLDKDQTVVAILPWSTANKHTGFSFEIITDISEVRCARCFHSFHISISDKRPSEEVYGRKAGWPLIEPLEFTPYCCPHCGAKIMGIYSYIDKSRED